MDLSGICGRRTEALLLLPSFVSGAGQESSFCARQMVSHYFGSRSGPSVDLTKSFATGFSSFMGSKAHGSRNLSLDPPKMKNDQG